MAVEDFPELRAELAEIGFELVFAREGAMVPEGRGLLRERPGRFVANEVAAPRGNNSVSASTAEGLLARIGSQLHDRSRRKPDPLSDQRGAVPMNVGLVTPRAQQEPQRAVPIAPDKGIAA